MTVTIRVNSPDVGYLNVRDYPDGNLVTTIPHNSVVTSAEPEADTLAKIGQEGHWLRIRLADGRAAYTAAWYLIAAQGAPSPVASAGMQVWVYSPEVGYLNIRSGPSTRDSIIAKAQHNEALTALEPAASVQAKVGQYGQWLNVQLANGQTGFAAASYLSPISLPPPDASLEPPEEDKIVVTNLSGTDRQVALIWNRLGGRLQTLAGQLGLDPGVAVAVWLVESGGRAFGADGRMIIRFENHIFYDRWGKNAAGIFAQHFTYNADKRWTGHQWRPSPNEGWRQCHSNQNSEWEVLNFACKLDDTAGKFSISMGGPQIMGFNYVTLGYSSVQEMFDAFAASEGHQVTGFFNFLRNSNSRTILCLQSADFEGFARIYNGGGQAAYYGRLIQQSYAIYQRLKAVSFSVSFGVEEADAAPVVELPPMVETDALRKILGIGPKTTAMFHAEGIYTFRQLAAIDAEYLRALLGAAVKRLRWIETWPAQARLAAWGDWAALADFQVGIKG